MPTFLIRRVLGLLGALVAASIVIFVAAEVLPGDPARALLGLNAEPSAVAALRHELGLDAPAPVRYMHWVAGVARGDLGTSWAYRMPVSDLLAERLTVTVPLALLAFALTLVIAFALGLAAALRYGRPADAAIMALSQIGIAIPNFWLGLLLILGLAVHLGWFPAGGFAGWEAGIGPALRSLTLPALSLAAVQAAILARIVRSSVLDAARGDFLRTARAKGLARAQAVLRHALHNALMPIITVLGLQFAYLIAGAVVIENVFFLPGLGRFVFQAIANRDLVVVESVVLLLTALVIVVTFVADVVAHAVDPRLAAAAP